MKRVLTLVLLATVSAAPALAQETGQLPRFEALEQQERALEQNRFDSLERQRQREIDRAGLPDSTVSRAERGRLWRDALIAATAAAHGFGLATRNRADFELLGGLLPADANPLRVAIWKP